MKYMCDFETTQNKEDCRVWAWAATPIPKNEEVRKELTTIGNTIDSFFDFIQPGNTYYFHNLKFDGEFILNYLFKKGYNWINKDKYTKLKENEFTTLISDMGIWYSIDIFKDGIIKIIDSLKIIPLAVSTISKSWGLEEAKLEIQYDDIRDENHQLTNQEKDYIINDVVIVAKALKSFFDMGLNRMTQGGNALYDFKKFIGGGKRFRTNFSNAIL